MFSLSFTKFEYSFPKRLSFKELTLILIIFIVVYGLFWPLLESGPALKESPMFYFARGLVFVFLSSLIAYSTAYIITKSLLKNNLEINKQGIKTFSRSFVLVSIVFCVHAIVSISLGLTVSVFITLPEWLVATTDHSNLSASEVILNVFLRQVIILPAYFIHSLTFLAYFYIFSKNMSVLESLQESIRSIGSRSIFITVLLFLSEFVLVVLENFVTSDISGVNLVIGSLFAWYIYAGTFLSLERSNSCTNSYVLL